MSFTECRSPITAIPTPHRVPRIRALSALDEHTGARLARSAAGRGTIFVVIWLLIAGPAAADLPIGLVAAAAATWASLRLLPAGRSRLQLRALAALVLH